MADETKETSPVQIGFEVDKLVGVMFNEVKIKRSKRVLILFIEDDKIKVENALKRTATTEECLNAFPEDKCRYIVWDVEIPTTFKTKRPRSKLYFFTWCPKLADTGNKMLYSSQRMKQLPKVITGTFDVNATQIEDVKAAVGERESDDDDSEPESWMEE